MTFKDETLLVCYVYDGLLFFVFRCPGDCSASTMWDNDYWVLLPEFRNLSEPMYTNADYIHHINPNTKFIAMIRNPVDRCVPNYLVDIVGWTWKYYWIKYQIKYHFAFNPRCVMMKNATEMKIKYRIKRGNVFTVDINDNIVPMTIWTATCC